MLDKNWSSLDEKATSSTQPAKKGRERRLIATKTCIVQLPGCDCEKMLVEGEPVTGLKPQEREHLLFHGFVE